MLPDVYCVCVCVCVCQKAWKYNIFLIWFTVVELVWHQLYSGFGYQYLATVDFIPLFWLSPFFELDLAIITFFSKFQVYLIIQTFVFLELSVNVSQFWLFYLTICSQTRTHTHMHTHAHRHTHTDTHAHRRTHRHTDTRIQTHTPTDRQTQRHTHTHTHTHIHTHSHTHTHTRTDTQSTENTPKTLFAVFLWRMFPLRKLNPQLMLDKN